MQGLKVNQSEENAQGSLKSLLVICRNLNICVAFLDPQKYVRTFQVSCRYLITQIVCYIFFGGVGFLFVSVCITALRCCVFKQLLFIVFDKQPKDGTYFKQSASS